MEVYPRGRDLRHHRGHVRAGRHRALAGDPRRRRLLGRVVRPVPPAHAGARAGRDRARGQGRARQARHGRQPAARRRLPASRASRPSRRSRTARSSTSSSAHSRRRRSSASSTRCVPSEADELVEDGDEAALRRALELEPGRADAAVPLARMLHERGERRGRTRGARTTSPARSRPTGSPPASGSSADPDAAAAFEALDAGDTESGLDRLIAADRHQRRRRAPRGPPTRRRRRARRARGRTPARPRVPSQARQRAVLIDTGVSIAAPPVRLLGDHPTRRKP